jgi:GNAT superfamily N-acetyltransferase
VVLDGAAYLSMTGSDSREPLTEQLSALWQTVFGDAPAYTALFFDTCFCPEQVLLWVEDKKILSMMFLLPVSLRDENGNCTRGRCLYAGATHPEHRGKGYFRALFRETDRRIGEWGESFALMHPAEESLYAFYHTLGYETAFTCTEITLAKTSHETECFVNPLSEEAFCALYREFGISRENVPLWDASVLPFVYRDALADGGGAFSVACAEKTIACGIFCRPDEDTVLIKDIACCNTEAVFPALQKNWPEKKIILRLSQKMAKKWDAGAVSQPFGMIKYSKEPFDNGALLREPGFMGAVLD